MSLDKPKARSEITSEIKQREHDQQKRLDDTLKVVNDKKKEADVAKGLRLSGTQEGVQAIKDAVNESVEATEREFEEQEEELDKKVFEPAKGLEKDLTERSDQAAQDEKELGRTTSSLDTKSAASKMEKAEKGAGEEREFLDKEKEHQESDRQKGEDEAQKQEAELKGTRVSFRV